MSNVCIAGATGCGRAELGVPVRAGTLLAIRLVLGRVGLTRGLDTLLFEHG